MADALTSRLDELAGLPEADRPEPLLVLGREVLEQQINGAIATSLVEHIVAVIEAGSGVHKLRLELGEVMGKLGDPRLRVPSDGDYWVTVPSDTSAIQIARFPATNSEYRVWVDAGGYTDRAAWTDAGWAWLQSTDDPWPVNAASEGSEPFVVPNQPVVGVTLYEAEAYARAMGVRLQRADERVWACRGQERRPYPWGSPFGEGNANTREEVLGRPCAVGLFVHDRTPEGVCDLAGNVAEWTEEEVADERVIHPGSWDQPSMAAWAKASALKSPDSRWAGLGFRLARD